MTDEIQNLPLITMLSKRRKNDEEINLFGQSQIQTHNQKENIRKRKYNTRSSKESKDSDMSDDEKYGNIEYTKIVVKALREAINENDTVNNGINKAYFKECKIGNRT